MSATAKVSMSTHPIADPPVRHRANH